MQHKKRTNTKQILSLLTTAALVHTALATTSCDWLYRTSSGEFYINVNSTTSTSTFPPASTSWSKIKISTSLTSPSSLTKITINTADFTFSSSTGTSSVHSVTQVPFASAFDCADNLVGAATIDLTGTPLAVRSGSSQFMQTGYEVTYSATCSNANQYCTVSCDGLCAACGPSSAGGETNLRNGGDYLSLSIVNSTNFVSCVESFPSITPTSSVSASRSATNSPSISVSSTVSPSITASSTVSLSISVSSTVSLSISVSSSVSATATTTPSATVSSTASKSTTTSVSVTSSCSASPSPTPTSSEDASSSSSDNTGAIAGGVVGVVAAGGILFAALWWFRRGNPKVGRSAAPHPQVQMAGRNHLPSVAVRQPQQHQPPRRASAPDEDIER